MRSFFAALVACAVLPAAANAVTIDFEAAGAGAPPLFNFNAGQTVAIDGITFSGGTLLNGEFSSVDQTAVYATAPFNSPSTSGSYSNPITIDLGRAFTQVSLDLVNESAGTYSVTTNTGLSQTLTLDGNVDQIFSLAGEGITSLSVLAVETTGVGPAYDFAIDNVTAAGAVPEPAAWALMLGGFGLVGTAMRRRQRTTVRFA
ncbi:PEPxxWA-CTERM sorting domain-containing protein [Sphingomonas nostoxanthinifaciens]|uniref:PEPxxWA-CTERM sorting domain-containing protein n=1 Tax=Sphingomonas nostoxanthinifaciens TaxID=2872652 RepID=UPI001CC1D236|nr:PEPxxWA-CTERM sorting domain-containing protein [Sphingomonas nostoxanthinifaciens]UAK23702.1 PEPxxWA-CTERM sorting domain-containing protein [Sphingomonas nostoxanthinifaciens]